MNYVNVASNMLNHEMICHKNHICDLCDPHELCGYVFSNNLNHEIICHKIHIHMNCVFMFLQTSYIGKGFTTGVTLAIFVASFIICFITVWMIFYWILSFKRFSANITINFFLLPSWTVVKCFFRYDFIVNTFSQILHLCFVFAFIVKTSFASS